ncbi:hypothetical protein K440DRAFT_253539 [Wilcoxina mikolae CBS 423.85]|nr:hypothetical protein K440DRAFT_253539 [Wilcoxina mikolae CBS 423.85]
MPRIFSSQKQLRSAANKSSGWICNSSQSKAEHKARRRPNHQTTLVLKRKNGGGLGEKKEGRFCATVEQSCACFVILVGFWKKRK